MPTNRLRQSLEHLRRALAPPGDATSDAQLLARFLIDREEGAFAALVRRHGPMVLGVCRRVLGHAQDAEDAFQATFLVLARKAASVRKRAAVGSWLYGVAYRTAREARDARARRRARERQMETMPHPEVQPAEPQDWRPVLDGELAGLPEKYRAAIVFCDLEGRSRREVARQLGLPEATLSSRLATGRRMLADRLSRRGVALSGGALAAALSQSTASAQVPAALVWSTAKAAAGNLAAASPAAAVLVKGVLRAMFLAKLKVAIGAVLVVAVLGAGGLAYRAGGAQAAPREKPRGELEELRKENELLRLNLRIVLEKCRAQESELLALKGKGRGEGPPTGGGMGGMGPGMGMRGGPGMGMMGGPPGMGMMGMRGGPGMGMMGGPRTKEPEATRQLEEALKALREARDAAAKRRAVDALDKAMRKLKEQLKEGGAPAKQ
jgi:RNA polymerase sigma factor (sigma-70 family)